MNVKDAIHYWEPRRIWYNLALLLLVGLVVVRTWPHFQPALSPRSLPPLLVLALLANLCYSAVYVVELAAQSSIRKGVHWRTGLLLFGILLALAIEYYWIMDEIYPDVPFTG